MQDGRARGRRGAAGRGLSAQSRRAALLRRLGVEDEEPRRADGGRVLSAIIAAGAHRVSAEEATRRTPEGAPKTLEWLAADLSLLCGRRARVQDVRQWLARNAPCVLAARLAAWEEGSRYLAAEHQPQRWARPAPRIVRWERRRDFEGARL